MTGDILEKKSKVISHGNINNNTELDQIIKKAEKNLGNQCFWVLYGQSEVLIGHGVSELASYSGVNTDVLKEIRLFSKTGELHIWKYKNLFSYRTRMDDCGEKSEQTYAEKHFLWKKREMDKNNKAKSQDGFPTINLHSSLTFMPEKYEVRNYFNFTDEGYIRFFDARLVEFIDEKGDNDNDGQ